ncbi:unnamed protein product [Pylaiella littoralis]
MVDVKNKRCTHRGCTKQPSYGVAGTKTAEFCSGHAKGGMVNVFKKKCTHRGCTKRPSYGVAGTKTAEFCSEHTTDGMVDVCKKRCSQPGCTTLPRFGVSGGIRTFCARHAEGGMVDVTASQNPSGTHGSSGGTALLHLTRRRHLRVGARRTASEPARSTSANL